MCAASDKQREAEVCYTSLRLFREIMSACMAKGFVTCQVSCVSERFLAHTPSHMADAIILFYVAVALAPG